MRKFFVFVGILLACSPNTNFVTGQSLRRMNLDPEDFVISDEKVNVFPLGFIYEISEPDSVFFFGCFNSNRKDVIDYIENDKGLKHPSDKHVVRVYGDFCDTVKFEPFNQKLKHFTPLEGNSKLDYSSAEYVLLYYFSKSIFDRHFARNIRFFKSYSEQFDGKVQLIIVKTQ